MRACVLAKFVSNAFFVCEHRLHRRMAVRLWLLVCVKVIESRAARFIGLIGLRLNFLCLNVSWLVGWLNDDDLVQHNTHIKLHIYINAVRTRQADRQTYKSAIERIRPIKRCAHDASTT